MRHLIVKIMLYIIIILIAIFIIIFYWRLPEKNEVSHKGSTELEFVHKGSSDKLIVFVHGLWSSPREAFSPDPKMPSWPELMSNDDRTMRAGPPLNEYSTAFLSYPASGNATLSIEQIANNLSFDLVNKGIFDNYNQIFFVCHSLGGLVIKKLFINLKISKPEYAKKITAVILISTPSQGAPAANFAKSIPSFIRGRLLIDLKPINTNTYLDSLENQWQTILRQRTTGYAFPHVYCAYETQKTGPITIVPQAYTATICDDTPRAENTDHIDIVKPTSIEASIYEWLRGLLAIIQQQQPPHSYVPSINALKVCDHLFKNQSEHGDINIQNKNTCDINGDIKFLDNNVDNKSKALCLQASTYDNNGSIISEPKYQKVEVNDSGWKSLLHDEGRLKTGMLYKIDIFIIDKNFNCEATDGPATQLLWSQSFNIR